MLYIAKKNHKKPGKSRGQWCPQQMAHSQSIRTFNEMNLKMATFEYAFDLEGMSTK
jgi:hypothetical protein